MNLRRFTYKQLNYLFLISAVLILGACDKNNNFNIFSIEDDKQLGKQVSDEIASNPQEYPVLSESEYSEAYSYLNDIVDKILVSEDISYKEDFVWEVKIIDQDILNAFAVPGGYIYVYTGLIKYLDKEDDLAGVLAHEIAHVDQRHSTQQLQKQYGIQLLLSVALGNNPGQLKEIAGALAGNLATLSFSRDDEREADEYSVYYLEETNYQCNAAFSFFEKILEGQESGGGTPAFLSTHPDPADRIADINATAQEIGCDTSPLAPASYQNFKNSLPN